MPNYDFRCVSCDHQFSKQVAISERDQVKCPVCAGDTKQLFTFSGLVKSNNGSQNSGCGRTGYG